jgi:hypothetical protein
LPWNFFGGTRKMRNDIRVACPWPRIWTQDLQNIKQKCRPLDQDIQFVSSISIYTNNTWVKFFHDC